MKKPTAKEFRQLLDKAITTTNKTAHALYPQRTNPSVAYEYHKSVGKLEALEAVKKAIEGNIVDLKILGLGE